MTSISSEKPVVAIAKLELRNQGLELQDQSSKVKDESMSFFSRHYPLTQKLDELDVQTVGIGKVAGAVEGDTFPTHLVFDAANGAMALRDESVSVDSAFDMSGGIGRFAPEIPALNPSGVREIVLSKQSQFDVLRPELGDAVPETVMAMATKEGILEGLLKIDADKVIIKPVGKDYDKKRGMAVGTKDEVIAKLDIVLENTDGEKDVVVIQEYMPEIRSDFASGLRYFDETDTEAAARAVGKDLELRVLLTDEDPKLVTGRLGADPENKIHGDAVFFDQESVPSHVYDLAIKTARAIRLGGKATNSLLAVDMTPDGSRIVEVNGRNIGTMRAYRSRPGSVQAADLMNTAIAEKLASMAHNKRGA